MDSSPSSRPHAHAATDIPIKRPPADEEPFDLDRAPPKRQAVEDPLSNGRVPTLRASSEATETQLGSMAPEQLISFIHNMQAVHARQIAELKDQHSLELEELTSLVYNHVTSQITVLESMQGRVSALVKAQPVVDSSMTITTTTPTNQSNVISRHTLLTASQNAVPAAISGPTSTLVQSSMSVPPQRDLSGSPATSTPVTFARGAPASTSHETVELKMTPSLVPNEPPIVEPSGLETVQELWEEYRYGRNGNPSLESLDARWGPRWRAGARMQTWYSKRKAILNKITQYIADGIDEQTAVAELEKMRRGRTLNWLSRILLEDRKATKKQWKEAQQAAKAAKRAMQEVLPAAGN